MRMYSSQLTVKTDGFNDTHDLTSGVDRILHESKLINGVSTVFVAGSTAGITTIEYESGAVEDLKKAIERIAPHDIDYAHNRRWGDGNGFSHVRAALLGPSLSIPFAAGKLRLGTWQQIVLIDFDNRPRTRDIIVHLVGE